MPLQEESMIADGYFQARKITLTIGDIVVTNEPSVLGTILGSCVSVCLFDERLKMGGMNHFMLPMPTGSAGNPACCGPESLNRLFAAFLRSGSSITDLKAKVFGGGTVVKGLSSGFDIGKDNVRVAKDMLRKYRIPVVNEVTGMDCDIKVFFHTETGRAFVKKIGTISTIVEH